jgi:CheY-like chemotaxis protein
VVDDDDANLLLLRRILSRRPDLEILTESNGARALDLIRRCNPALVLSDLNLPGIEGDDILRELRGDPATAAVPLYIISGDSSPATVDRLYGAGVDGYLTKPFRVDAVLAIVQRHVPVTSLPPQ